MTEHPVSDDILNFGSKKKKKKSVLSTETDTITNNDAETLDFGIKKKKKDKPLNLEDEENKPTKNNDFPLDEMKITKKKKKVTVSADDVEDLTEKLNNELSFGEKKKRKKSRLVDIDVEGDEANAVASETLGKDSSGYDYEMLLARIFAQLEDQNPELVSDKKRKVVTAPPQMARIGTKKTLFVNYADICRSLNRDSSHLATYILTELGAQGSVDANGALIIRGRFTNKHMEPVLRNYCRNYVLCHTCQSPDTELCKDSRLLFLHCRRCTSRMSVKTVSSGFQAVTGKRAALRAKTQ